MADNFYIVAEIDGEQVRFMLDATTDITTTYTSKTTNLPVAAGVVADNIENDNPTISFTGVVSSIKPFEVNFTEDTEFEGFTNAFYKESKGVKTPYEYLTGLLKVRENREPFIVNFSADLPPMENCFFNTFSFIQNSTYGVVTPVGDDAPLVVTAYKVNLSFTSFKVVGKAAETTIKASELADSTQDLTEGSGSTHEEVTYTAQERQALGKKQQEDGSALFLGESP